MRGPNSSQPRARIRFHAVETIARSLLNIREATPVRPELLSTGTHASILDRSLANQPDLPTQEAATTGSLRPSLTQEMGTGMSILPDSHSGVRSYVPDLVDRAIKSEQAERRELIARLPLRERR
jgi:hypothetical protein